MNQIGPIDTEIWFWTDNSVDGRRQNYIPSTSSGDNKRACSKRTPYILDIKVHCSYHGGEHCALIETTFNNLYEYESCENRLEEVQGATTSSHIPPPLLQDPWPCVQLLRAERHAPCSMPVKLGHLPRRTCSACNAMIGP